MKRTKTGQPRPVRGFKPAPTPNPNGTRAERRYAAKTGRAPHLRDAATLCLAVLSVPGDQMVCELPAGHLDNGVQHKSGCTRWGRPTPAEERP